MTEQNKTIAKTVRRTEYQAWKRLRLAAYVVAVGAVGSGLAFRSAYAGLQDQGMAMGRELMQVGDVVRDKYRVRVNGEPVWVNNVNVDGTKKEILDKAEAMCRQHSGGLEEEYKKFPAEFRKTISGAEESAVMGVLRQEAGDEGVVACIVNPKASGGFNGFVGRMEEFGKTRDLASIGNLRYVYVKESGGTTRMLTAFTEGSFRLDRFAPEVGEPAGTDPTDAPRPKSSVRLMSAEVDGAAYGTRMYESTESSKTILAQFDAEMPGHGWTNPAPIPGREQEARLFMKDGQDFILLASEDRGRTYVTMIQSVTRQARSRVSAKLILSQYTLAGSNVDSGRSPRLLDLSSSQGPLHRRIDGAGPLAFHRVEREVAVTLSPRNGRRRTRGRAIGNWEDRSRFRWASATRFGACSLDERSMKRQGFAPPPLPHCGKKTFSCLSHGVVPTPLSLTYSRLPHEQARAPYRDRGRRCRLASAVLVPASLRARHVRW
jgi:hypothetical protein